MAKTGINDAIAAKTPCFALSLALILLVMAETEIYYKSNRELLTGNREKREYFAIIFKHKAYLLYLASFIKFFCSDTTYYVLRIQNLLLFLLLFQV